METAFYFYTIIVMLVCIAAGTISLSAYFVSRKRINLYMVSFFFFYFLDLALIFQYEYLGQNIEYSLDTFYLIDQPVLKTVLVLGTLESLWLVTCDYLDERRWSLRIAPAVVFVAASFLVIWLMPEGSFKQWTFYSLRQIFFLWVLTYSLMRYIKTDSEVEAIRLRRQKLLFAIVFAFTLLILIEDTFMILIWDPDITSIPALLPLYISERNFSENILMLFLAFFSLRESAAILKLRFKEPPASEDPTLQMHIDGLLPAFCERHGLTAREREILALVLTGKDNQNIASDLQLAVGTVKAHVHNILKKTGHGTRHDLVCDFWKE